MALPPADQMNNRLKICVLYLVEHFVSGLGFGVATVLLVQALRRLSVIQKITGQRPKKLLYSVLILQLVLTVPYYLLFFASSVGQVAQWQFSGTGSNLRFETHTRATYYVFAASDLVAHIQTDLGDALVIWRAWCLYPYNRVVRSTLIFLTCCLLCTTLISMGGRIYASVDPAGNVKYGSTLNKLVGANTFTSFGVNLVSTILIARIAWIHRQILRQTSSMRRFTRAISTTLNRAIESGSILCIVQFVAAVLTVAYTEDDPSDVGYVVCAAFRVLLQAFIVAQPALLVLVLFDPSGTETNVVDDVHKTKANSPHMQVKPETRLSTLHFASTPQDVATGSEGEEGESSGRDTRHLGESSKV